MFVIKLCVLLAFVGVLMAYDLSAIMREFYCVHNGNYTDTKQLASDDSGHTPATLKLQPINSPLLSQLPVMYFEQTDNGKVVRSEVGIFREGQNGTIYMRPYNISGISEEKPGTFDPQDLKTIESSRLQGRADCEVAFKRVAPFIFVMDFPDCKLAAVNGHRGAYDATFTCTTAAIIVPVGAAENVTLEPYIIDLKGDKFPLEGAPDNYVCDCSNTSG